MKAYAVYVGDSPWNEGCVLVFAESRNAARVIGVRYGPWHANYLDMTALRKPDYDQWFTPWLKNNVGSVPLIETNEELPPGCHTFFDDRIW